MLLFVRKLFFPVQIFDDKQMVDFKFEFSPVSQLSEIHRYIGAELTVMFEKFPLLLQTLIRKYILLEIISITEYISLSNGREKIS